MYLLVYILRNWPPPLLHTHTVGCTLCTDACFTMKYFVGSEEFVPVELAVTLLWPCMSVLSLTQVQVPLDLPQVCASSDSHDRVRLHSTLHHVTGDPARCKIYTVWKRGPVVVVALRGCLSRITKQSWLYVTENEPFLMRWVTAGHEIESKVEHSIGLGSFLTRWVTRLKVRLDCHYLFAQFQPHVSQFCDLVMCQDLDSLRMSPGRYSAKCHFWFLWPSMTSLMNIPEWSVIICKICCYFFLVLLCFSLPQNRPTGKMYDVVGARLTSSEEWLWKDLVANRCRGGDLHPPRVCFRGM